MLRHRETRFSSLAILIGFQVALIASFLAIGLWALPFVDADDTKAIVVGFVAAVTMGFQRALSYFLVRHVAGTVSLTHITQTMVDMGELVYETSVKTRSTAPGHLEESWIAIAPFCLWCDGGNSRVSGAFVLVISYLNRHAALACRFSSRPSWTGPQRPPK